jgi:hypothetical protein
MELYIRFMTTLAFGLVGLGMVMKVLLENLFHDWDAFADLGAWMRSLSETKRPSWEEERVEDILLELEKAKAPTFNTRLIDVRREQLRERDAVEHRLKQNNASVRPTPIEPFPFDEAPPTETESQAWYGR